MINELIKQIQDRGLDPGIGPWLEKRLLKEACTLTEAEHLLDWIEAVKPPKLQKMRLVEAKTNADKWSKAQQAKGNDISETAKDVKLFMEVGGFEIVQLVGENAFKREGLLMAHCCASYYGKKDTKIYSLRDNKNMPHCTIEVTGGNNIQQIKGKGNGEIHPNYIEAVIAFLEKIGLPVRDSEMENLGYINKEWLVFKETDGRNSKWKGASSFL